MIKGAILAAIIALWVTLITRVIRHMLPRRHKARRLCGLHAARVLKRGEWALVIPYECEVCKNIDDEFPGGGVA